MYYYLFYKYIFVKIKLKYRVYNISELYKVLNIRIKGKNYRENTKTNKVSGRINFCNFCYI